MQPEGHGGPCAMGEQGSAPSGVYDYGTLEEVKRRNVPLPSEELVPLPPLFEFTKSDPRSSCQSLAIPASSVRSVRPAGPGPVRARFRS